MKLPSPLYRGELIQRYKRFLADVRLEDGEVITAHCPNPGAMTGLKTPGSTVWLSKSDNPKRKLAYTFELIEYEGQLVGINTNHPNKIVADAIENGEIPELAGYASQRREVKYGTNSRIDILLESDGKPPCYVEIKNVHLKRDDGPNPEAAEFPDSVTARGAKHLGELANVVKTGGRAVSVYLVQRMDCSHFTLAADIDPKYASAFADAKAAGVETICYQCNLTLDEITVLKPLPVRILHPSNY